MKKLFHFYRHCPHCRTGILILVTILLIIAANLFYFYDQQDEFLGRLRSKKVSSPPALTGRGGGYGKQAGQTYQISSVLIPARDEITGKPSVFAIVCQTEEFPILGLYHACQYPKVHRSIQKVRDVANSLQGVKLVELFRPQDENNDDVLDLTAWTDFVFDFLKILLNLDENVQGWFIRSHGIISRDFAELAAASFIKGADKNFYTELKNRVWERAIVNRRVLQALSEMKINSADMLFGVGGDGLSFSGYFLGGVWRYRPLPDFAFMGFCYSVNGNLSFAKKLYVGSPGMDYCYDTNSDIVSFLGKLLGTVENGRLRSTDAAKDDERYHIAFVNPLGLNYTLSPAVAKRPVIECLTPDSYQVKFDLDTAADDAQDVYFVTDGNLGTVTYEWDNYVNFNDKVTLPSQILVSGTCTGGPCQGMLSITNLDGAAIEFTGDGRLKQIGHQGLNGNFVPEGTNGVLQNYRDEITRVLDDPYKVEIDCSRRRPKTDEESASSSYCGNHQVDPGEDCDPPGSNCWVEGEKGKQKGAAPSTCDPLCHCPL